MDFLKDKHIINGLLGTYWGEFLIAILVLAFSYNYILKSGIIQHLFFVINFKSWKVKKEIEQITELLDNTELSETMKKNLKFRVKLLYLQLTLKTKETDLEILEYLSGYCDLNSAMKKYNRSKKKLVFVPQNQSFSLSPNYSFDQNFKKAQRRNSWIPFWYWVLTLPAIIWVLYLNNFKHFDSPSTNLFYSAPMTMSLFTIWVFSIAFFLRHLLEKANAVELLHMERIQR